MINAHLLANLFIEDPIVAGGYPIMGVWPGGQYPNGWALMTTAADTIRIPYTTQFYGDSYIQVTTSPIRYNTWYHFVFQRVSNVMKIYLNGVQSPETKTESSNIIGPTNTTFFIGKMNQSTEWYFNGLMGQLRITKAARPISTPTAAFPENGDDPYWNDVVLLTKPVNGVLTDLKNHTITPHNNPQIDNANTLFGLPTVSLSGNNYYTVGIYPEINTLGSGDFTVEAWCLFK